MDPLMHLTIPLLVALALRRWDKKKLLLFSLFALAPDLDYFFNHHRIVITHSTLTLIIFPLVLFLISKIVNRYEEESFLFLLFLSSHFFLDFSAGIYLLWPFSNTTHYLVAALPLEGYWVSKPIVGIYNTDIQINELKAISSHGSCIALYLIFIFLVSLIPAGRHSGLTKPLKLVRATDRV